MRLGCLMTMLLVSGVCCYGFEQYLQEFGKSYPLQQEYSLRKAIFHINYTRIQQANAQNLGYTLKVNNLTDWTQEELDALLNSKETANGPNDPLPTKTVGKVSAVDSIDWDRMGMVTAAKDQGSCGACWAFSAVATYQSFLAIQGNPKQDLSDEYVLECSIGSCQGGQIGDAFSLIAEEKQQGVPPTSKYAYKAGKIRTGKPKTSGICKSSHLEKINRQITYKRYMWVPDQQMKGLLLTGPVAASMKAQNNFLHFGGGVYSCTGPTAIEQLNHAVSVIGYSGEGWLVKNSWGRNWGNNGKAILSYHNNCGILIAVYQFIDTGVAAFSYLISFASILWAVIFLC